MSSYGFDIQKSIDNRKLLVINLDPSDFSLAIQGLKNEIPVLIRKTQADRFIIDPISLFEDLFDDDATRRRELMRFLETLRDMTNCTFLFTSETDRANPLSSRYNLIEYLSDTVISLRYVRSVEANEVHLAVEVIKMRMSPHFREAKPYELKSGMIEVYIDANVF
jgi:KaiC/GvpD/RAD55 family RecA-like ATPase